MERAADFWTLMRIGRLRLAVPQHQVRTLEPVLDLRPSLGTLEVGSMEIEEGSWPVFCVGEDLVPVPVLPDSHRICVLMSVGEGVFGLSCERVDNVAAETIRTLALPGAVASGASPVRSLGVHQDAVVCITSAAALAAMLRRHGWRPDAREGEPVAAEVA